MKEKDVAELGFAADELKASLARAEQDAAQNKASFEHHLRLKDSDLATIRATLEELKKSMDSKLEEAARVQVATEETVSQQASEMTRLGGQSDDLRVELKGSQEKMESVAAEKMAAQTELTALQSLSEDQLNSLREQNETLERSQELSKLVSEKAVASAVTS